MTRVRDIRHHSPVRSPAAAADGVAVGVEAKEVKLLSVDSLNPEDSWNPEDSLNLCGETGTWVDCGLGLLHRNPWVYTGRLVATETLVVCT